MSQIKILISVFSYMAGRIKLYICSPAEEYRQFRDPEPTQSMSSEQEFSIPFLEYRNYDYPNGDKLQW
jgi:hypothetical protein